MCRIKTGNRIQTREDVVNLVTAILLRQRKDFSISHIINTVDHYMEGAVYQISYRRLETIIRDDIDVMKRNKEIRCKNGRYYPLDIM